MGVQVQADPEPQGNHSSERPDNFIRPRRAARAMGVGFEKRRRREKEIRRLARTARTTHHTTIWNSRSIWIPYIWPRQSLTIEEDWF